MNVRLSLVSASLFALSLGVIPATSYAAWPQSVAGDTMPSLAPMLEHVTPAVVSISVKGTQRSTRKVPEIFKPFFGQNEQVRERPFRGLGSGVIIDAKKGYIVTNHHVINQADDIQVMLDDGRQIDAKFIGSDPESDVALLQIKADDLTEISLSDSDKLRVGDFTVAIGNPFGLGQTVTSGIVSALGRSGLNLENLENFIQTDAAINSGNSGGALVNLRGELIGINTAIIGPNGGNVGIGFAIPANMVDNLVKQIIEFGEVRRGVLGIAGQPLTPELAKNFGHKTKYGAFINQVMPNSAAEDAGLQPGDIIVKVNGKNIKGFAELRAKVATLGAGSQVELAVVRNGKMESFTATLKQSQRSNLQAGTIHPALTGATLSDNDGQHQGIIIDKLEAGSAAAQIGLKEGDLIIGVDRDDTLSLKELREYLKERDGIAALRIIRDNRNMFLILR